MWISHCGWEKDSKHQKPKVYVRKKVNNFYSSLEIVYVLQKYDGHHIWNAGESGSQGNKNGWARVLYMRGARQVHQQIPNEREHLFVFSCIYANKRSIPNLKNSTFLKGMQLQRMWDRRMHGHTTKCMWPHSYLTSGLTTYLLDGSKNLFGELTSLDHGRICKHVTIEVETKVQTNLGWTLLQFLKLTLSSQTLHNLQFLNMYCFKSLKQHSEHVGIFGH